MPIDHLYMGLHVRPTPMPEGYVHDENRVPLVLGISAALLVLTLLTVSLRFYSRLKVTKRLYNDDWAILGSVSLATAFSIGICYSTKIGIGHHSWKIASEHFKHLRKSIFAFELLYPPAIFTIKASLLLFYLRVGEVSKMRYLFRTLMGFLVATLVAFEVALALRCIPIDFEDETPPGYHCVNELWLYNANGIVNILTDVVILIIPIPLVVRLPLKTREKVAVICLFGVGGAACAASFCRLFTLRDLTYTTDVTWHLVEVAIWSQVEIDLGIICACVPCIRAIFLRHKIHKLPFSFISRIHQRSTATTSTARNRRRLMSFRRPITISTWASTATRSLGTNVTRGSSKFTSTMGTRNWSISGGGGHTRSTSGGGAYPEPGNRIIYPDVPPITPEGGQVGGVGGGGHWGRGEGNSSVTRMPQACMCDRHRAMRSGEFVEDGEDIDHDAVEYTFNYTGRHGSVGGGGGNASTFGLPQRLAPLPPLSESLLFRDDPITPSQSPVSNDVALQVSGDVDLEKGEGSGTRTVADGADVDTLLYLTGLQSGVRAPPPTRKRSHSSAAKDVQPYGARWTLSSFRTESEAGSSHSNISNTGDEPKEIRGSDDSLTLSYRDKRAVGQNRQRRKVPDEKDNMNIKPAPSVPASIKSPSCSDPELIRRDSFGNPISTSPMSKAESQSGVRNST